MCISISHIQECCEQIENFSCDSGRCPKLRLTDNSYNPGQNYLRKFSPSCPLSYARKLFPKRRLCGKKTPSPNSMLLPTNAQGSGFLLNTQQHCFQGKGEREEPVQLRCLEKCCPSIQFSQQFCPRLQRLALPLKRRMFILSTKD